jgi:hypothetical protein
VTSDSDLLIDYYHHKRVQDHGELTVVSSTLSESAMRSIGSGVPSARRRANQDWHLRAHERVFFLQCACTGPGKIVLHRRPVATYWDCF